MARQVKTVAFEEPVSEVENPPAIPPAMDMRSDKPWSDVTDPDVVAVPDQETELNRILSEVGQGDEAGKVIIYRINKETRKQEWVARYTSSEFTALGLPGLAKRFGAGEYILYIYPPSGRLTARRVVTIAEDNQREQAAGAPLAGMESLVSAMKDGFLQLGAMIAQQSKGPTEKEILDRMLLYKQLFGGGQQQNNGDRTFEQMRAAIDFVKDLRPSKADEGFSGTLLKFIEKFSPTINKAIEAAQQQAAAPSVQLPAQPVAQPQPQQPQFEGDNAVMFQNAMMKAYLDLLVGSAAQEADPYTYANVILDKVPDELLDQWLAKNDLIGELAKFDSRVNQFRNWFTRLQSAVIELRQQENEPENDPLENDPASQA